MYLHAARSFAGLSMSQHDTVSSNSVENQSHVTTFCSFADTCSPKFGILKNVLGMKFDRASRHPDTDDGEYNPSSTCTQDVLGHQVARLVSMGYQVNHFVMNSEDYGSCQRRERAISNMVAPGFTPIEKSSATYGMPAARENGPILPDEEDRSSLTPFRSFNSGDGMEDLPSVDIVHACLLFPDHRLPYNASGKITREYAQETLDESEMPYGERTRLRKCCLAPTMRTTNNRQSKRRGPWLHWQEHRLLTVPEARWDPAALRNTSSLLPTPAHTPDLERSSESEVNPVRYTIRELRRAR